MGANTIIWLEYGESWIYWLSDFHYVPMITVKEQLRFGPFGKTKNETENSNWFRTESKKNKSEIET